MKYKNNIQKLRSSLLMTTALVLAATPSFAVDLMAVEGTWTSSAGGAAVPMWGFATDAGSCPGAPVVWGVGPELIGDDLVGGDLTINLRNCLTEPVSIMISGQNAVYSPPVRNADGRITAFTKEALPGGTASYTWTDVSDNPGTYLYMSGSHPAKQVHMGLYGSLKVGQYLGTSADVTLLYSEIDPVLHSTATTATPLTYKPRHYLVNGVEEITLAAGDTSQPTVLSFINAGLSFHVPALNKGYMSLKAEDGNPYPYSKEEYSVKLAPGKTIEAFWQPTAEGEYVIYDRSGNGMVAKLTVGVGGAPAPAVANDSYSTDEDIELVVAAPGVSLNDDPGFDVELVGGTSSGVLSCSTGVFLCADGSFNYQPDADFNGSDTFTYKTVATATTPSSSVATVTITVNPVNDAPVAFDDAYNAVSGVPLNVAAPGLLVNDVDPDDALIVTGSTLPLPGIVNSDGSFTIPAPVDGSYSYTVCEDNPAPQCTTGNFTVTVSAANSAPIATDDSYEAFPGVPLIVPGPGPDFLPGLLANDSDPDGDLPLTVTASTLPDGANLDGSFSIAAPVAGSYTYTVCDNNPTQLCDTGNVTITMGANDVPVANDDSTTVRRNSVADNPADDDDFKRNNFSVVANDTDANGIDATSVVITGEDAAGTAITSMGGTIVNNRDGTVSYWAVPFGPAGIDTFTYTVSDTLGAVSNSATVSINVVRERDLPPLP